METIMHHTVPNRVFMQIKEFSWLSGHKGDEREACAHTAIYDCGH